MSQAQVDALHALIHRPSAARGSRWTRRDRGIDVVWAGTLALLLALAVVSIDCGKAFVETADRLQAVATTRAATIATDAKRDLAARQSSLATSRTI